MLAIIMPVAAYLALSTIAAVVLGKRIARADRLQRRVYGEAALKPYEALYAGPADDGDSAPCTP